MQKEGTGHGGHVHDVSDHIGNSESDISFHAADQFSLWSVRSALMFAPPITLLFAIAWEKYHQSQ